MSGEGVPYHLRPHKAVDRRLFLDLLSRFERWQPLSDYVYVSMGAYPLEDHKLVHRIIGIKKLLAFDFNPDVVARQRFNRPLESCHCLEKQSGELIDRLEPILRECSLSSDKGLIIWLDHTDPKKIGEQIREFQTLLDKLRAGDLVRVTVNAHPHELIAQPAAGEKPPLANEKRDRQFLVLKSRIGEYLPSWADPSFMTAEQLPLVLSAAFSSAALKSLPVTGPYTFAPLSIVRYADGLQMLSITGVLVGLQEQANLYERLQLDQWPFASKDWGTIHHLVVPHLTVRETLFLERGVMTKSASTLIDDLGFEYASDVKVADFLDSYKKYYRFYPSVLPTEL